LTNLQNLILNIREDIPDRTDGDDPHLDGRAFSLATILRWINDAGDLMCTKANIITDWYAIPSVAGQDVYELPDFITSVEQLWFNLLPLSRSPQYDNIFTVKRTGSSWWFSPHSHGITPRLYLFPAPADNAASTQLNGTLNATALTVTVDSTSGFNEYGYLKVDDELIRYSTVTSSTALSNLLRAQAGTTAAAHSDNATAQDQNIAFKCFRLPRHVETADDVLEIPLGLHPLIQLYAASRVLSAEQDKKAGMEMRMAFDQAVDQLAAKPITKGNRQGTQVKTWPDGGIEAQTRIYFP